MDDLYHVIDGMREEIITFLQKMIQIPSENPPGDYQRICQFLEEEFLKYKFEVSVVDAPENEISKFGLMSPRRNVLARYRGNGQGLSLILNAHVDTVPVGDLQRWTYAPFSGAIHDGRIYGRGATDSKGRIAAYVMAAVALKRAGYHFDGDLTIAATCDEETGGQFGAGYVTNNGFVSGDMAVVEGYSNEVIRAMAGVLIVRIKVRGESAHVGWKWKGVNAIEKMANIISSLGELQTELEHEASAVKGMRYTAINVGLIKGGTKTNVVPETCEIDVECRVIPEHSLDFIYGRIHEVIMKLQQADSQLNVEITRLTEFDVNPTIVSENARVINELEKAIKEVRGSETPLVGVLGQSDSKWFLKNGIEAVNFGPGTSNNYVHHPDEFMDIEDLVENVKIIATLAKNVVCKKEGYNGYI